MQFFVLRLGHENAGEVKVLKKLKDFRIFAKKIRFLPTVLNENNSKPISNNFDNFFLELFSLDWA